METHAQAPNGIEVSIHRADAVGERSRVTGSVTVHRSGRVENLVVRLVLHNVRLGQHADATVVRQVFAVGAFVVGGYGFDFELLTTTPVASRFDTAAGERWWTVEAQLEPSGLAGSAEVVMVPAVSRIDIGDHRESEPVREVIEAIRQRSTTAPSTRLLVGVGLVLAVATEIPVIGVVSFALFSSFAALIRLVELGRMSRRRPVPATDPAARPSGAATIQSRGDWAVVDVPRQAGDWVASLMLFEGFRPALAGAGLGDQPAEPAGAADAVQVFARDLHRGRNTIELAVPESAIPSSDGPLLVNWYELRVHTRDGRQLGERQIARVDRPLERN